MEVLMTLIIAFCAILNFTFLLVLNKKIKEFEIRLNNLYYKCLMEIWHDCKEELPPYGMEVNVRFKNGKYGNSRYMKNGTWAFNIKPTHWKLIYER